MQNRLIETHPLSFSKEWPDNIIVLENRGNPPRVNWSFHGNSKVTESNTPDNSKREYI